MNFRAYLYCTWLATLPVTLGHYMLFLPRLDGGKFQEVKHATNKNPKQKHNPWSNNLDTCNRFAVNTRTSDSGADLRLVGQLQAVDNETKHLSHRQANSQHGCIDISHPTQHLYIYICCVSQEEIVCRREGGQTLFSHQTS